jgi:hypothetical protein
LKTKAIYTGRRFNGKELNACFLIGKKELFFRVRGYKFIGDIYEIDVKGKDASLQQNQCGSSPEKEDPRLEKWIALDAVAVAEHKKKRAAVKQQQLKTLKEDIKCLNKYVKHLDFFQKSALVTYIIHELLEDEK